MRFAVNESLSPIDRINAAAEFIFGGESGLAVATVEFEGGAQFEVVLAAGQDDRGSLHAVGLSRDQDGRIGYEHHYVFAPAAGDELHDATCVPNADSAICAKPDTILPIGKIILPTHVLGGTRVVGGRAVAETGQGDRAPMVEHLTHEGYARFCHTTPDARATLVAMGGASRFFRDYGLRRRIVNVGL